MRKLALFLLLLTALPAHAAEPIKIGGLFSLTDLPEHMIPARDAAQMAVDEVNAAGGVHGQSVKLIVMDDKGNPSDAVLAAESLTNRDHVAALMGTIYTNASLAVSEFAHQHKIPYFAMWAASNDAGWKNFNPYLFVNQPAPAIWAGGLAMEAAKNPAKRWAIISYNYEYGLAMAKAFKERLSALRPDVQFVAEQYPALGKMDTGSVVNGILHAKPEAVFTTLFTDDLSSYTRYLKRKKADTFFQVNSELGFAETARTLKNELPIGWLVSGIPTESLTMPGYKKFRADFNAKYGHMPESSALLSYINMKFLLTAMQKANAINGDAIAKAAEGLSLKTPIGPLTMRAIDHRSTMPYWVGYSALENGQPIMRDAKPMDLKALVPSDAWIKQQREVK